MYYTYLIFRLDSNVDYSRTFFPLLLEECREALLAGDLSFPEQNQRVIPGPGVRATSPSPSCWIRATVAGLRDTVESRMSLSLSLPADASISGLGSSQDPRLGRLCEITLTLDQVVCTTALQAAACPTTGSRFNSSAAANSFMAGDLLLVYGQDWKR